MERSQGRAIDPISWATAPYHPTPTIVEAARSLYAQHSVEAIARFDAGAKNLRVTSRRIEELADEARQTRRKIICFVTGVPGAGKTLVGLNVATRRHDKDKPTHAVFLSGNGPLVAVLREALTRDEVARRKTRGEKVRKGKVGESVKAFIQNVHHFRDEALRDARPPIEHVVIFDEAQRAWNLRQTANFMQRKKNQADFAQSEPEFLISYMNRHHDWAAIICLVGGGQEIHTGEGGIDAWLNAITQSFSDYHAYISSRLLKNTQSASKHTYHTRLSLRCELTFPNSYHAPTRFPKSARHKKIARDVLRKLRQPEIEPRLWRVTKLAADVSMPEAAVDKDRDSMFGKNKVWFPKHVSISPPTSDSFCAEKTNKS